MTPLIRRLFAEVPDLRDVPAIRLVLDGTPFANCAEVTIGATDLLWSAGHTVTAASPEGQP